MNMITLTIADRAVRTARPRPVYDLEMLKAYAAEYAAEEEALAESDRVHRADLLAHEDQACGRRQASCRSMAESRSRR